MTLKNYEKLNVYIDSKDFSKDEVERLLAYNIEREWNRYILSVVEVPYPDAPKSEKGRKCLITYDEIHGGVRMESPDGEWLGSSVFYGRLGIKATATKLFNDSSEKSLNKTVKVLLVERTRFVEDELSILITKDKSILSHKDWLSNKSKGRSLIVDYSEGEQIIGLFLRQRSFYYLLKDFDFKVTLDQGMYLLVNTRSLLPHLQLGHSEIENEIAFKVESLLLTLDELGSIYYGDVNNNTNFMNRYYFYIFLTTICGVLDALAIKVANFINLNISDSKKSLNNARGGWQDYRSGLLNLGYTELVKLIEDFQPIIGMLYNLRNTLVHKEGYAVVNYDDQHSLMFIDDDVRSLLMTAKSACLKQSIFFANGMVRKNNIPEVIMGKNLLSPYIFAKTFFKELCDFLDEVLKLSGNSNFLEQNPEVRLVQNIKAFKEKALYIIA